MTDQTPPSDALTALLEATARLVQSSQQQNAKIDALTDQIGHLSEVVTAGFSELKAIVEKQSQTADKQADAIRSLADSVAALIAKS